MWKGIVILALALCAPASAVPLRAQQFNAWDVPSFLSPGPHHDLGFYYIKAKDTDWGIAATWRRSGDLNLGVRGAYVRLDDAGGQISGGWALGLESWGALGAVAPPLALSWTAGLGVLLGAGGGALRLPGGLCLGLPLVVGRLLLLPYVNPRVSLAYLSGRGRRSTTALQLDTEAGVDVALSPAVWLRIGASFGDQPAYGAGAALRLGH